MRSKVSHAGINKFASFSACVLFQAIERLFLCVCLSGREGNTCHKSPARAWSVFLKTVTQYFVMFDVFFLMGSPF